MIVKYVVQCGSKIYFEIITLKGSYIPTAYIYILSLIYKPVNFSPSVCSFQHTSEQVTTITYLIGHSNLMQILFVLPLKHFPLSDKFYQLQKRLFI